MMEEAGKALHRVAAVVGIGQTDWREDWRRSRAGEKPADSVGYAAFALRHALEDAGISRDEIDGLIVGPTTAYERMGEVLGIEPKWGSQADAVNAVMQACMAIRSGLASVVALVYGNDQRTAGTQYGGPQAMGGTNYLSYVYHAPWGFTSQGAIYALMFRAYQHERGFSDMELGEVSVAQRRWASLNPEAIQQKPITLDDYMASAYVCEPLRLFDYCLINDGGVALIIADAERARKISSKPVYIEAIARHDVNRNATSLEPRLTDFYLPGQQASARRLFDIAGIGPGGGLPVNTSGGHLSESYMQGWNHQLESVRQLRGACGARQVEGCRFVHYSSDVAGKATSILYGR